MQENDIVKLKSGGPKMTITKIFHGHHHNHKHQDFDAEFADCIYFNTKNELKIANRIKISTLILIEEE